MAARKDESKVKLIKLFKLPLKRTATGVATKEGYSRLKLFRREIQIIPYECK